MTVQAYSSAPVPEANDTLALIIVCPECRTQRAFCVNAVMENIQNKDMSGHEIRTECEDCKHKITVQVAWVQRMPGWTVKPVELLGPKVEGEDDMDMSEQSR